MNPYGADFGAANHDFAAVEGKDSDGDGFSNIDEIKADTFPGDPNDNPNSKPKEQPKPPPPSTTTTTGLLDSILGLHPEGLAENSRTGRLCGILDAQQERQGGQT